MDEKVTLGVLIGNRGFFPDHLVSEGREEILKVLKEQGIETIALSKEDTEYGSVETLDDAVKCANLFKANREKIHGVLVSLPNFGDERGVANTLKMAGLDVPVLVQAFPDELGKMDLANRRDSFCGKMSVCNNLRQYGIEYSLTELHTVSPSSDDFKGDLQWFTALCRVIHGLKNARIGAIGARTTAFNTVRFSEKLLQDSGITVETIDLSEIFAETEKMSADDKAVKEKIETVKCYIDSEGVPQEALLRMAKLSTVIDNWMEENQLVATAVQCWTSMEENFGIVPCAVMGMMSENLMPSACEVDVCGAVGMYALELASGKPSALVDWNNNYGEDPDKCVLFHCSNWPKSMLKDPKMVYQDIIAGTVGEENSYGACVGRIPAGPMTFARVSTADTEGAVMAYIGEGEFTNDDLNTFGGRGVLEVTGLQDLLYFICENGFEHHVAINSSSVSGVLYEAFEKYLGWEVYYHNPSY
ncbi:fucose isomerase [Candidatus Poribacteria bacterium]|nr:fucose isomerase [Candidatus Poribacteria bacterium]